MGQSLSPEECVVELAKYSDALLGSDQWHGFGIDRRVLFTVPYTMSALVTFSGLNSTAVLLSYRDQMLQGDDLSSYAANIERLGSALSGFALVPNVVGLGALIISMILETVGKSLGKQTTGTADILRRVFAEEKASEIRDLMDEYLKRLKINLRNQQLQLKDTKEYELKLSVQLTRLKNSMLVDGHMSTKFLKQWVNGAAFHTQMLIHEARMERGDGARAKQAVAFYKAELDRLLQHYKSYLESSIKVITGHDYISVGCCLYYYENQRFHLPVNCFKLRDEYCFTRTEVVEDLFTKRQLNEAKTYFSDLQANVQTLISQRGTFLIRS